VSNADWFHSINEESEIPEDGERVCALCGESWPETEEFYFRRGNGFHSYCKACSTQRKRELRSGAPRLIRACRRGSVPLNVVLDVWDVVQEIKQMNVVV
jgi:hypothetical protein